MAVDAGRNLKGGKIPGPRSKVFGLDMSMQMQKRLLAAIRGTYPHETGGLSDEAAMQAVLKQWAAGVLRGWEVQQSAGESLEDALQRVRDEVVERQQDADATVVLEAESDIQPTVSQ